MYQIVLRIAIYILTEDFLSCVTKIVTSCRIHFDKIQTHQILNFIRFVKRVLWTVYSRSGISRRIRLWSGCVLSNIALFLWPVLPRKEHSIFLHWSCDLIYFLDFSCVTFLRNPGFSCSVILPLFSYLYN